MPGGFIGVDIFFVISGYLITSIIREEIHSGTFSIANFYARRVRRIFPALIAVLVASTLGGYFLLAPGDYQSLGQSAVAAAASLSNVYFNFNTGYFDNAAETMPLLHTWSLGVEEQFYVGFPLLLCLLSKTRLRNRMPAILLFIFAIGFAASVWRVHVDQKSAFYLVQYRAWELGAGALLAYIPGRLQKLPKPIWSVISLIGLGLIAYSLLSVHPVGTFPGFGALPAVLGAVLILAQSARPGVVNRVLTVPPMISAGKISYSLYLWHWPLIVFWRHYANGAPPSVVEQFAIGAISIAAATISWRWIETPFRHSSAARYRTIFAGVVAMAIGIVPSALIARDGGWPSRIPAQYASFQSKAEMWNWDCPGTVTIGSEWICTAGRSWNNAKEKALLLGDSHAQHLMPLMHEAGLSAGMSIGALANCPPIFGRGPDGLRLFDPSNNDRCFDARKRLFETLRADPAIKTVIITGLWSFLGHAVYRTDAERSDIARAEATHSDKLQAENFERGRQYIKQEIRALAGDLARDGKRLVVASDIPVFKADPIPCVMANSGALLRRACPVRQEFIDRSEMRKYQFPIVETLREAVAGFPNTSIVVPTDYLCQAAHCETYVDGVFIYRDANHLRRNMPEQIYVTLARQLGFTTALAKISAADRPDTYSKAEGSK